MIEIKTKLEDYEYSKATILDTDVENLKHDCLILHALIDALEEWKYNNPNENAYFDIIKDAEEILRETYGVTE